MESNQIENIQSQMKKGLLEFCILSILKRGEAYPSDIVEELKASGMQVLEGTVYPLLTRMKNAGYLDYRWEESNAGPPRKYYRMSDTGTQFHEKLYTTWHEISNAVNKITKNK